MGHRTRVVIDTNVFISALLIDTSIPRKVVDEIFHNRYVDLIFSEETFLELSDQLHSKKFRKSISTITAFLFLKKSARISQLAKVREKITDCRDRRDNKFLEVAVSGNANYIITGDKDLLELNPYRSIQIITPRDFLEPERKAA